MSSRAGRSARALTLLIVWSVALGALFAALLALAPAARAGTCDQVGGVITGDWTITNTQVCSGILYSVDGTISINSGGSLTLTDGGLSFSKDTSHEGYALNVNAGGELVLDHSIVTTQTDSISPFLKLAFTVSGANSRFTMKNSASLKFPGWFNATSATINVTDSKITGFTDSELTGLGINTDDNNDAPLMAWTTATASVYRSRIERLYEYPEVGVVGVQVARRGQEDVSWGAAGVFVEAFDPGAIHARGRGRPCHQRRVVVVIRVDAETGELGIREARHLRVRDVDRGARGVQPTGEFQRSAGLRREPAVRARDREGQFQEGRNGVRLGRDDRVVEHEFAARVHVERVAFVRCVLGKTQAAVGQREAAAGVDADRAVDRVEDPAAHLRVRDRPVPGDDATDLVAGSGPRGRGERKERSDQSAEGDRPNDEEREGPRIPFGRARHRTTSRG